MGQALSPPGPVTASALARLFLLCTVPLLSHAADRCPWINTATASGLLGSDVTARLTDTSCTFQSPQAELKIEVTTKPSTVPCPTGTPLKAIGNEARLCDGSDHDGRWALVAGRVRDQFFTVRISSADAAAQTADLREKARKAAEQIAGILF
ncbi:MAG TPA: hypothetical protein VFA04_17485 [Bryobacteraceae bacterium]|nr:hypothetical protein [Bryobacteraceae bacterium]